MKNIDEGDPASAKAPLFCSYRLVLALVGCLGCMTVYALRVNLSVAMVCMVNQTHLQELKHQTQVNGDNMTSPGYVAAVTMEESKCVPKTSNSTLSQDGEFPWSKEMQGIILGAFFWGYLITQVPGGLLAERFGGKRVFGYSMLATIIATLLSPVGARASPYLLVVLRIIKGLGEGVAFPSLHSIWAKWAPPLERSKLIGFTYAGAQIGNVITLPISGVLCSYGFDGGWPSIFYIFGILGIIWFALWMFLVSDTPSKHPRISDKERIYIDSSIGTTRTDKRKELGTPWRAMGRSVPVWAIIIGHTFANWGTYTLLTNIPAYMKEVLKFDIKSNGAFSALPYIAFWACINLGGWLADALRVRGWRTINVRRLVNSLGTLLPGGLLIVTGYITCDRAYAAVAVLTVAVGCSGFHYTGVMVNHVDIAPPFAGTLFGISNTVATLSGILAPYAVGIITTEQTQAQWQTVFYVSAAIYTVGNIFFCVFLDGEIQSWAKPYMFDDPDAGTELTIKVTPPEGTPDEKKPMKENEA